MVVAINERTHIEQRISYQDDAASVGEIIVLVTDDFRRFVFRNPHKLRFLEQVTRAFARW